MHKKRLSIFITILFLFAGAFAYSTDSSLLEKSFVPVSPEIMGQGGAFIADAHGYNALFYNPAGFARSDRSLTISDTTAWVYANPARFMDSIGNAGTEEVTNFVNQEINLRIEKEEIKLFSVTKMLSSQLVKSFWNEGKYTINVTIRMIITHNLLFLIEKEKGLIFKTVSPDLLLLVSPNVYKQVLVVLKLTEITLSLYFSFF